MKMKPSTIMFSAAGIVAVGLIAFAINQSSMTPSKYDSVAQCLTDNNVTMFGAWWCPHCEEQKEAFGSAFENINYVECSPGGSREMSQECQDEGIEGYPTWRFADGSELSGNVPVARLAERAGCEMPSEGSSE
jgi:hypothetical protein